MFELILIKTNNSKELKKLLKEKNIDYETNQLKISQAIIKEFQAERKLKEQELAQAYEEWANNSEEWENEDKAWND